MKGMTTNVQPVGQSPQVAQEPRRPKTLSQKRSKPSNGETACFKEVLNEILKWKDNER